MTLLASVLAVLFSVSAAYKDPHYVKGHDTMVHLFEWKWNDIAKECESFLGPMGYGGVQVSPIQENVIVSPRPWWERYQPLSYKWITRSGNEEEFKDMVRRCNRAGVRIYVDVVFNHMSANHKDAVGTGGSRADTYKREYPAVPYSIKDFHPKCDITDYHNRTNVRNCELVGLHDLDQSSEYVRGKIVEFLNAAIDAGVAGFRVDAAKHMWPQDLQVIYSRLKNLNTQHGFPSNSRPFIFQEVIDYGGETITKQEYTFAAVTEFRYGREISNSFFGNNLLKWFVNWGEAWALLPSQDALVFIDNHDTQRSDGVLTYRISKLYKMAVALMLAHPYGTPRVMSSYHFNKFDDSPPADSSGNLLSPIIHEDNTCGNGWVCEHRWRQIYNMARFRLAANGTGLNDWWDNGSNQIAFCRGNNGFIAINADHWDLKRTFDSCLPPGTYCDVISGNLENGRCTGKVVKVTEDRKAYVEILTNEEDGVLALHINARAG
ncbi:hypothetical protein KPH14_008807 [Odynerus spinipes]|uniref:Alpha-amylase n=1 Tax=Odynerus spinipes TaxID=1348599 RepID=A0AAD9VHR3_9HYME|nr:hypothetical protein KPH14_008807 [Odynerus spinipes]